MISGKAICVYCSSSDAVASVYFEAARELGHALAENGHTLIYGGGNRGLMGEVARAVHEAGGRVVGVIPEALMAQHYRQADETIVTADMRERKATMESRADAFIGLPGGFGTLEEVLEILTLKQLRYHNKAIVLANIEGYYSHLAAMFEHLYEHRFSKSDYRALYYVTSSIIDALTYIEAYVPTDLPDKLYDPHTSPHNRMPE
jgi:hypothetical protein